MIESHWLFGHMAKDCSGLKNMSCISPILVRGPRLWPTYPRTKDTPGLKSWFLIGLSRWMTPGYGLCALV